MRSKKKNDLAFSLCLTPPTSSVSFFHCSSYKYAEMKYTLLLVVNDVLWYSLHLWIVLCLLCMMYYYDISIYDKSKKKKRYPRLQNYAVFLLYGIHVK